MEDLFKLVGKKALVVGGGLGIGRASAELLGGAGADVAIIDVERDRADGVAAAIAAGGVAGFGLVADVLDKERGPAAVDDAANRLGGLDIMVTVVGRSTYAPLIEMTDEHFELDLNRNMGYVRRLCRAFAQRLAADGHGGAIVNIASVSGLRGAPGNAGYGAAKAALISLTRSMAVEWAPLGIRVNCIAPGSIATDHWVSSRGAGAEEEATRRAAEVPMKRMGEQFEIGKAVLFLASDMASYVTGETLVVDGGRTVRP